MTTVPAAGCDCRRCPLWIHNPAATEPICSGRNTDCVWCSCSVGNAWQQPAPTAAGTSCEACPVRCGSRPDMRRWVDSAGGTFTFDDVYLPQTRWPLTVPFVPLLMSMDVTPIHQALTWPAYGIPAKRLVSRRPGTSGPLKLQPRWAEQGAHQVLGLDPATQQAVLACYGKDHLLERLWTRRHTDGLLEQIVTAGFDLVLGPDFSVYGDQPRGEQLLNMRRSLWFAQELSDAGVLTAPAVYMFRAEDVERWASWAADTSPPALFLPRHTFKGADAWREMVVPSSRLLAALLNDAAVPTRIVVSGVVSVRRLRELKTIFGARLVVASQNPLQSAIKGYRIQPDGPQVKVQAAWPDLFATNVRTCARIVR